MNSQYSGSFNLFDVISPLQGMFTLLAHEIGHDIWGPHLAPFTGNGVPFYPPLGSTSVSGDRWVAHGLMVSRQNADGRASANDITSAAERAFVSRTIANPADRWITCSPLVNGSTYTLGDIALTGDCFTLPVGAGGANNARELYFSNVQRGTPFNVQRTPLTLVSANCPGCVAVEGGLPTTGLLVEYVSRGLNPGESWTRDVVPADNQLSGFQGCDLLAGVGLTSEQVYGGDFWRPGVDRQLTPWTSPNVYGYNTLAGLPSVALSSGRHAIDGIRAGSGTNVVFDYYQNYNQLPFAYVREDWFIGPDAANAGLTFNTVTVEAGAQLAIGNTTVTFNGDLVVQDGATLAVSPGAVLQFAQGKRLIVYGAAVVVDATLTASKASEGWGGVLVSTPPGGTPSLVPPNGPQGRFEGATINGVKYGATFGMAYPARSSVEVVNRSVALTDGTTVTGVTGGNANGVSATGSSAVVTVSDPTTVIEGNAGLGVLASSGAQVAVAGGAIVRFNAKGGVRAVGYGTRATVTGYAEVDLNPSVGILAESQAHAVVRSPAGTLNTSVSLNDGGPTARSGGSIDGGQCGSEGATGRANLFESNHNRPGGTNLWDASAKGGSSVVARRAYWDGRVASALLLDPDASSTIDVTPTAAALNTPDPTCPIIGRPGPTAGPDRWTGRDTDRTESAVASRGTGASATVVALATLARETAWAGDTTAAFVTLAAAADSASTEDDRAAVFEATAALLADAQPGAIVAALAAEAAGPGPDAPWAARALVVAFAQAEQTSNAETIAASLATGSETSHASFGHGVLVRLAAESDSADYAISRLVDFAGAVVDADTASVEAFGSALALVAARFPDADLSGVTGLAGRGTSEASSVLAGTDRGTISDGVSVWPNPAAGRGTVRVSLSVMAQSAIVAVYDALGRRVATLHDGPLAAGANDLAFETSALAPGLYVVSVRVSQESGLAWTEVQRVTVAR